MTKEAKKKDVKKNGKKTNGLPQITKKKFLMDFSKYPDVLKEVIKKAVHKKWMPNPSEMIFRNSASDLQPTTLLDIGMKGLNPVIVLLAVQLARKYEVRLQKEKEKTLKKLQKTRQKQQKKTNKKNKKKGDDDDSLFSSSSSSEDEK